MTKGDFFKRVKQWEIATPNFSLEGKTPTFYYDNTATTAIYTASTDKIRKLLPLPDMHPVEIWPGRALVAFTAFEYRSSDIDPYNEFSISFVISFGKKTIPGFSVLAMMTKRYFKAYVWQLPVTTERARKGGVDIFGYPKFIGDIVFSDAADSLTCSLSEGGKNILALKGSKLKTAPEKVSRFKTYSVKDGVPLVTNVFMNPLEFGKSASPKAAELSLGTHKISEKLKAVNLSATPVFFQYMPRMEAILYWPRNLMDD